MRIKDIATQFRNAGINARPKALNIVLNAIKEVENIMKEKNMDLDMEAENDIKKANDMSSSENAIRVIQYFIKKFKELRSYGGGSCENMMELTTANQIVQSLTLEELSSIEMGGDKPEERKDLSKAILNASDKIMEDKEKEIEDPNFDVLTKEIIVLDTFSDLPQPKILGPKIVYQAGKGQSLLSGAHSRINYFQTRMKILEDQIMSVPEFVRPTLKHSDVKFMETDTTVAVNRVNAILGTTHKLCCLGILVRGEDGNLYLEDDTMRVKLNLTNARSDQQTYFTVGSTVLVEGHYDSSSFIADFLTQPSLIKKPTRREVADNDNYGAYSYVKNHVLSNLEEVGKLAIGEKAQEGFQVDQNKGILIMSNLCLDEPNTLETVEKVFESYEQFNNI